MEQEDSSGPPPRELNRDEIEMRRYEARLGLWKVILGTFIVGLAGILIPGAVSFYNSHFENARKQTELEIEDQRKQTELRLSEQAAHQQYIKDFFATAINQDIELRLRFANYFARLSGSGQDTLWQAYYRDLKELRDLNRKRINELEDALVELKKKPDAERDVAAYDRVVRELSWLNDEIGYKPSERSTIVALPDKAAIDRKRALYEETVNLVDSIVSRSGPVNQAPLEIERFWTLYRKDLIGVESRRFAQTMIAIGNELNALSEAGAPPGEKLASLARELKLIAETELGIETAYRTQVPTAQQQFQTAE